MSWIAKNSDDYAAKLDIDGEKVTNVMIKMMMMKKMVWIYYRAGSGLSWSDAG